MKVVLANLPSQNITKAMHKFLTFHGSEKFTGIRVPPVQLYRNLPIKAWCSFKFINHVTNRLGADW